MFGRRNSTESPAKKPELVTTNAPKPKVPPVSKGFHPYIAHSAPLPTDQNVIPLKNNTNIVNLPSTKSNAHLMAAKDTIYTLLMKRIDIASSSRLPREALKQPILKMIEEIVIEKKLPINQPEQQWLAAQILDDLLGNGPLEPLLHDETITDILVNGPNQVYVERNGLLELTDVTFRDDAHVLSIASRIVAQGGRRIDESTPICDARLPDGSRVTVVASPCAVHGTSISIRKFAKREITLDTMVEQKNISPALGKLLTICAAMRLNVLITGGAGSGKTTMLNALSRMISPRERVVTIEDTAELQLQQPHVVTLETRHANLEGQGEITVRDLVKTALRMRPDRIILGEVRGGEAFDLLQAMNTGHDGSMGTLHANTPRESLSRLEHMIGMAGVTMSNKAMLAQIANSVHLIIQISRMRDGVRRVTHVTEIVGVEGEVITMQDLFTFEYKGEDANDQIIGEFKSTGIRPRFAKSAAYYGLEKELLDAMMG
jgi:pilus assembly protein CpaF